MEEKEVFTYDSKIKEARIQIWEANNLCRRISNKVEDKLSKEFPDLVVEKVELMIDPTKSWVGVKIILEDGSDKEASLTVDVDRLLYKVSVNLPKNQLHRLGLFVETVLRVFTDEFVETVLRVFTDEFVETVLRVFTDEREN